MSSFVEVARKKTIAKANFEKDNKLKYFENRNILLRLKLEISQAKKKAIDSYPLFLTILV